MFAVEAAKGQCSEMLLASSEGGSLLQKAVSSKGGNLVSASLRSYCNTLALSLFCTLAHNSMISVY